MEKGLAQQNSTIYRLKFSGHASLGFGNGPLNFMVDPWPGNAVFENDASCAKLAAFFFANNRHDPTGQTRTFADIQIEDFAVERVALAGVGTGNRNSTLCFDMILRVQSTRRVDAEALGWVCREAASSIIPDGGWSMAANSVKFEFQELDWMDQPCNAEKNWIPKSKMPSTGRGSVDEWFAAIAVDDVETVGRMIFAGFDPATLPREDVPPYAPEYQSFAQPNGLWHAAKAGAINCLRELLRAGLDPTDSFFGESALMAARAAPKNGSAIVEAFIEAAGDKAGELIDRPWRYMSPGSKSRGNGQTAAMLFAQANKVDALEALIKAGAYIDGHDDLNRTIEDLSAMDCKEVIAAARANTVARPDSRAAEAWRETEGVLAAIGKRLSSSRGLRSIDPSSPTPSQRNRAPD